MTTMTTIALMTNKLTLGLPPDPPQRAKFIIGIICLILSVSHDMYNILIPSWSLVERFKQSGKVTPVVGFDNSSSAFWS